MFQNCVHLLQIVKQSTLKCSNISKFKEIYLNFEETAVWLLYLAIFPWEIPSIFQNSIQLLKIMKHYTLKCFNIQ